MCIHSFCKQVHEKTIEYTFCKNEQGIACADVIAKNINEKCTCRLNFTLDEEMERDVFIYYGLTNYYQNHRRYVKSRDDKQLLGVINEALTSDCDPFTYVDGDKHNKPYAPCGAIANSLFNDTIELQIQDPDRQYSYVKQLHTGIAWATDKKSKFKNPEGSSLEVAFQKYEKPPNWQKPIWKLDVKDPNNNGFLHEHLIVWMRTAALPTFRKLYGRIDHSSDPPVHNGLPASNYVLVIDYSK